MNNAKGQGHFLILVCYLLGAQGALAAKPSADKAREGGDIVGAISVCTGSAEGVTVAIPGTSFDARTGSSGDFRLSYVQPGTYTVYALRGNTRIAMQSGVIVVKGQVNDLGPWQICRDADNDGFTEDVDCDDANGAVNPGAEELCDGIDNNCNAQTDEGCQTCTDNDDDSFYAQVDCGTPVDCDDSDPIINPDATEICDGGIDNNCNGLADDQDTNVEDQQLFYADSDADSYGSDLTTIYACDIPSDYSAVGGDCDDDDPGVNPGATEICDGVDNDCDGVTDDEWPNVGDLCSVGIGECTTEGTFSCSIDGTSEVCSAEPGIPTAEICDGLDNDCDGEVDEGLAEPVQCGPSNAGVCNGWVDIPQCIDGEFTPAQCLNEPPGYVVTETAPTNCDGLDNDCDGVVDEGCE